MTVSLFHSSSFLDYMSFFTFVLWRHVFFLFFFFLIKKLPTIEILLFFLFYVHDTIKSDSRRPNVKFLVFFFNFILHMWLMYLCIIHRYGPFDFRIMISDKHTIRYSLLFKYHHKTI